MEKKRSGNLTVTKDIHFSLSGARTKTTIYESDYQILYVSSGAGYPNQGYTRAVVEYFVRLPEAELKMHEENGLIDFIAKDFLKVIEKRKATIIKQRERK